MSDELDKEVRDLLAHGKGARMPQQDRQRIRRSVLAQIAAGAAGTGTALGAASAAASGGAVSGGLSGLKILVIATLAIGVGAGSWISYEALTVDDRAAPTTQPGLAQHAEEAGPSEPAAPPVVPPADPVEEEEVQESDERRNPQRPRPASGTQQAAPPSTLSAELSLLRRALSALHAGRHAEALADLRRHAELYPSGTMVPERVIGEVQALCALGRRDEAERARAAFLADSPRSGIRSRLERACPP